MSSSMHMDDIIEKVGGCGLYQVMIGTIVHVGKAGVTWTMLMMTFAAQDPGFWCLHDDIQEENNTHTSVCMLGNTSSCSEYRFDDSMKTVVSEYTLVCDKAWIVANITSIQMAGVLVGAFLSGHLGDSIGRRPTFYLAALIVAVFDVCIVFSPSWQAHAAILFCLGLGCGIYFAIQYTIVLEFVDARWRARFLGIPSWSLTSSLFALVAWVFKDWKHIHIASAVALVPLLLTFRVVPESARWLLTKKKLDTFEKVIKRMASWNGKEMPDLAEIKAVAIEISRKDHQDKRHYTAIDVFRYSPLITVVLFFIWMSMGFAYYGIAFGVKNLSGDLYLNLFLMSVIEAPVHLSLIFFANRFGRKKTFGVGFMVAGLCGLFVGSLVYIDVPSKGILTNVFALSSKFVIGLSWNCITIFTSEIYPTVIRTIAGGLHGTAARVGGMLAPQIVYLNDSNPGLLFFMSGSLLIISSLLCLIFPETKDLVLEDVISKNKHYEASTSITNDKDDT